ncbi:MAG: hypothetical protein ACTS9Y_00755 [Methylophilus sp.]|uniref:hypothetical protein n=1 Tax=Methylophilus sp. TaxID=29541 RepID=UPI003FA03509
MTGHYYIDSGEGIIDDGEFISWDWLNQHIHDQDIRAQFPNASPALIEVFNDLVSVAIEYKELTGQYLQIWGAMGEAFSQAHYGIKLHKPHTPGSDGKLGNDFIEVKTISPEKGSAEVSVKTSGNFNKLLVVKINEDFTFDSVLIDRKDLIKKSETQIPKAKITWDQASLISKPTDEKKAV